MIGTPTLSTASSSNSGWFGSYSLLKSLCQSVIVFSKSDASSPTWPTGDRATATFGARTPLLAPLVSFQHAHVLHGDARAEWMRPFPLCLASLARSAPAASSPLRAHSGELVCAPRCIAVHQTPPIAPPCAALHSPPSSSPRNPPVSRHFLLHPNWVAVTIFFGELNAGLLGASHLL